MSSTAVAGGRLTLFGRRPPTPRPLLLMIVFGVFLVVVGLTATAQTLLVSLHVSTATLNATVSSDAATIRTFVNGALTAADLAGTSPPSRTQLVEVGLRAIAARGEILRIEIRDPSGVVRFASDEGIRGLTGPTTEAFQRALGGQVDAALVGVGAPIETVGPPMAARHLVREYFPLIAADGTVQGVVAIWRDAHPILAGIERVQRDVLVVTLSAAAIVSILLYLVFRAAQRRITTQTAQLIAATRLDALTGLPNHGALVADLALSIEAARADGTIVGVALVDLDNFKLVNDTYRHETGDRALRQLAASVQAALPEGCIAGRYGPDEVLVFGPATDVAALETMVAWIRQDLATLSLEVEETELIPIMISAGIAQYPDHAGSVTELLSRVAIVASEARGGGGNVTRVANAEPTPTVEAGGFDVLQGLVFAIDTKDRYTRLHSDDVARYSVFLAGLIGLEPEMIAAIRRAALLHDVGKIGIPDAILRKPGKLTASEYDVVKQHVVLGDAIVRNVENIDVVKVAIRYHHERWDGRGYLEELEGERIPLVARILAVADAFSAMTTTRPYRKALPVGEALQRLGDAAGTQLEERLAVAFIRGIEHVPEAPLPGEEGRARLFVPRARIA